MTNKKRNHMSSSLPKLDRLPPVPEAVAELTTVEVQTTETAPASTAECRLVSISIPLIEPCAVKSFQDESHRVDLKNMTRERLRKLKAIRRGFIASGATLANGADIRTNADAIYCLLDSIEV